MTYAGSNGLGNLPALEKEYSCLDLDEFKGL
jgi:hypothetical protein